MQLRALLLAASVFVASPPAFGQDTTGTISGRVLDSQKLAIPGATVSVVGPQGRKQAVTDSAGTYTIPFLTPGTYTVSVELAGFKTTERREIGVASGQKVDVPVTMQGGAVAETVQVAGAPDVIDTRATMTGASFTSQQLEQIPVGRNLSQVLYLSPGVTSTAADNNPSISGGNGLDNQYVIDGVNVTNQGSGAIGSYSSVLGSLGNATPFDFIEEVQVKTGGYQAEFGSATGGVVNVITRSGSNDVSGSLFGYARPRLLDSPWKQYQSGNGSVQIVGSRSYDTGGAVGIPIVKDRVFFFGAINPARNIQTLHAPQGFPLSTLRDVDRVRDTVTYSAKATWNAGTAHRVDVSVFGDPSRGDYGPQRPSALLVTDKSSFSSVDYAGHNQTIRYNGIFRDSWLVEGSFARAQNTIEEVPGADQWRVTNQTVRPAIVTGGIGLYEPANHSLNRQFSAKSTHLWHSHEIKYGAEYELADWSQIDQRTGPTFTAPDGRRTATGAQITVSPDVHFGQIFRVTRASFNSGRAVSQRYLDVFVQDSWRAGSRLTINPGVRYDQETMTGTLVEHVAMKNNWAARIGATFDATGDGRTKIYGNYGRYYARVPSDLAARALSAEDTITRADYFDAGLTRPIPNGVATVDPSTGVYATNHFLESGGSAATIDPNARLSFIDEGVIGIEREVAPQTGVGVYYIYRRMGRVLEDVATAPMVAYDLGVPGLSSVKYILTNPTSATPVASTAAFLGASFDNPVHRYQAVELTVNRRLSNNWSVVGSYRWSRLRGNFAGFYRDDNGQSDHGITSLYDFPTNDPSYAALGGPQFGYRGDIRYLGDPNGILPLDRPHQFKAFGNYTFPPGLNVGFALDVSSGAPLTPLAANPNYASGGEIPEAPRGSGIQTIDGFKRRTPVVSRVDMQASYRVRFSGARSLTLLADVFNLFNWRTTLMYDQWTQLAGPAANPDTGAPITQVLSGAPPQFQAPRQVRLGARLSF